MRALPPLALFADHTFIQISLTTNQVDGQVLPAMRNGIAALADHERSVRLETTISKRVEELQQPLACLTHTSMIFGQALLLTTKRVPETKQPGPGHIDCLVQPLSLVMVILRSQPLQLGGLGIADAAKQVHGENSPFAFDEIGRAHV